MEYKTKPEENEFTQMIQYIKNQYLKQKGKMKRFEDIDLMNQPTTLGKMLLYS